MELLARTSGIAVAYLRVVAIVVSFLLVLPPPAVLAASGNAAK